MHLSTLGRGRPVLPGAQRGASCPVDHPYRGPLLFSTHLSPALIRSFRRGAYLHVFVLERLASGVGRVRAYAVLREDPARAILRHQIVDPTRHLEPRASRCSGDRSARPALFSGASSASVNSEEEGLDTYTVELTSKTLLGHLITVELTSKTLLGHLIAGEFNSPANSLRMPYVPVSTRTFSDGGCFILVVVGSAFSPLTAVKHFCGGASDLVFEGAKSCSEG
eukprot:6005305-Pyramimonas_sp.AAC.1